MPGKWSLSRLSLRARVLALFSLIMLTAMSIGAVLLISNARSAVLEEIRASEELARKLAITAISNITRVSALDAILSDLPVQLHRPRHVRITILDPSDQPVLGPQPIADGDAASTDDVPRWFAALLRPPPKIIRIPIVVSMSKVGTVIITTEPSDEIAEVWKDFRSMFVLIAAACAGLIVAIHWAVSTALAPLARISRGLELLENGDYGQRLPLITVPDLRPIGIRFNALAAKLHATLQEKEELHRQLVTAQDTERKNIAHELHDEFGPCLFGIKVDASFIASEAGKLSDAGGAALAERADAILSIAEHMQNHNRALLYRLRPMVLGEVSLVDLLEKLVDGFRFRHTEIDWHLTTPEHLGSYGETIDLTIYRTVQECLTNAARHAAASAVDVRLDFAPDRRCTRKDAVSQAIQIRVQDDGKGFDGSAAFGFGLTGLSQRVTAIGGKFTIAASPQGGTIVDVSIPIGSRDRAAAAMLPLSKHEGTTHEASAGDR